MLTELLSKEPAKLSLGDESIKSYKGFIFDLLFFYTNLPSTNISPNYRPCESLKDPFLLTLPKESIKKTPFAIRLLF